MNKTAIIVIGAVLAVAVGAVVIWLVVSSIRPVEDMSADQNGIVQQEDTPSNEVPLDPDAATPAEEAQQAATVTIANSTFTPAQLTVKKGTTVTWTNRDSMGHNVVSDEDAPEGGPPKESELFGQGEAFSFTFDTVGTFPYHCTPHPFMQGTVEVVE